MARDFAKGRRKLLWSAIFGQLSNDLRLRDLEKARFSRGKKSEKSLETLKAPKSHPQGHHDQLSFIALDRFLVLN